MILDKISLLFYVPRVAVFYRTLTFVGFASYDPALLIVALVIDVLGLISSYI